MPQLHKRRMAGTTAPRPDKPGERLFRVMVQRALGWMADAACADNPTISVDDFFPEHGGGDRKALTVCFDCNVRRECMDYAIEHERIGIWGGTKEQQRAKVRKGIITADDLFGWSADEWQSRNEVMPRMEDV